MAPPVNAYELKRRIYATRAEVMKERYVDIKDMLLTLHPEAWAGVRRTAMYGHHVSEDGEDRFCGFLVYLDDRLAPDAAVLRSELAL